MLVGTRSFSDEDITEVLGDAINIYHGICAAYVVEEPMQPALFQACINMVGQRSVPVGLEQLGRHFGGESH